MYKPQKNSKHTVLIDGYSSDGAGVARVDGVTVFVKGAIRGELCGIKVLKSLKNMAFAIVENVLEPSEHRTQPGCHAFGRCGGCGLWHMDYEEELFFKKKKVEDALRHIGKIELEAERVIGAENITRYRNKAIYAVGKKDGRAATGFFRRRSHDLVPIQGCAIQAEAAEKAMGAVRRWVDECDVSVYNEASGKGALRNVYVRTSRSGNSLITLVVTKWTLPHIDRLIECILKDCPKTIGIILNRNNSFGNTVLTGDFRTLWGMEWIEDEICGLKFRISTRAFCQVNLEQAEKLYACVSEYADIKGHETALDLYCGVGTITLRLARDAGRMLGAEIVESAVTDAIENASMNGINNTEFFCEDAERVAERILEDGINVKTVVLDPPRKGLAPGVISHVADINPERIVYVSCDSATMSRDCAMFWEHGYKAERLSVIDMFPRTPNVESCVLLSNTTLGRV